MRGDAHDHQAVTCGSWCPGPSQHQQRGLLVLPPPLLLPGGLRRRAPPDQGPAWDRGVARGAGATLSAQDGPELPPRQTPSRLLQTTPGHPEGPGAPSWKVTRRLPGLPHRRLQTGASSGGLGARPLVLLSPKAQGLLQNLSPVLLILSSLSAFKSLSHSSRRFQREGEVIPRPPAHSCPFSLTTAPLPPTPRARFSSFRPS